MLYMHITSKVRYALKISIKFIKCFLMTGFLYDSITARGIAKKFSVVTIEPSKYISFENSNTFKVFREWCDLQCTYNAKLYPTLYTSGLLN